MARLVQSAKVVSADCTRLAVVFHQAPPPPAHECGVVCRKVEQSVLQLAAAFYQLHIRHGKNLTLEVRAVVVLFNTLVLLLHDLYVNFVSCS